VRHFQGRQKLLTQGELRSLLEEHKAQGRALHGGETCEDLHIPSDVAQELGSELSKLTANPYGEETQFQFVTAAKNIMLERLPQECLARVEALRQSGHRGILRVRGLPVDAEPGPTPVDGLEPLPGKASFVGEGVHLGIAALLGSVYTLEFEKAHRVIHTVAPVKGRETFPGSVGSAHAFGMHQEDRMHPYSPEVLVLTCLRADAEGQAETCAGSFWDIAPDLCREENADALQALQESNFALKLPLLFQQQGRDNEEVGPILSFEEGVPSLAVNMNGMRALNARGQHALDTLSLLFEKTWSRMRMSSGEMVLLVNKLAVHTRTTAFTVRADGTDRWLLRTFVHPRPPAGVIPKTRAEWNTMAIAMEEQDKALGAEEPRNGGSALFGLVLLALLGALGAILRCVGLSMPLPGAAAVLRLSSLILALALAAVLIHERVGQLAFGYWTLGCSAAWPGQPLSRHPRTLPSSSSGRRSSCITPRAGTAHGVPLPQAAVQSRRR